MTKLASPTALPSLYERYQLDQVFTAEKYKDKTERGLAAVHFLIALDQPLERIIEYMDIKLKESCKAHINIKHSQHRLTALHVAVIKERFPVAEALVKRGADLTAQDAYGFTPWLHTALTAEYVTMKKLLETSTSDMHKWLRLRQNAGFEPKQYSLSNVEYEAKKSLKSIDVKTALGLEEYTDAVLYPPLLHVYLWQTEQEKSGPKERAVSQFFIKKAATGLPKFLIKSLPHLAQTEKNRGLFLLNDIPAGSAIGWYGGEAQGLVTAYAFSEKIHNFLQLVKAERSPDDYCAALDSHVEINAVKKGNAIRFANDGWPNATYILFGDEGVMISLVSIRAGTEITWDYGPGCGNVKWGSYMLTKREEIRDYVKQAKGSLQEIAEDFVDKLKRYHACGVNDRKHIKYYVEVQETKLRWKFIFHTPLVLIDLCVYDLLNAEEALLLLSKEENREFLQVDTFAGHFIWTEALLIKLVELQQLMSKLSKKQKEAIFSHFEKKILNCFPVTKIVKILSELTQHLQVNNLQEFLKKDWKEAMQNYDWEEDSEGILMAFIHGKYAYEQVTDAPRTGKDQKEDKKE